MRTENKKSGRVQFASGCAGRVACAEELEQRHMLSNPPFQAGHTIVEMTTNNGAVMIELFDDTAPLTVQNFLHYVNTDHYDNTFFHRLARGFVLQGGHFFLDENGAPQQRDTDPPVVNEFGASNTERTLAMAKLGGDPNSATDQFFFNLNNNAENLDNQNGGFTVFGQVVNGWNHVLEMSRLSTTAAGDSPFDSVPIQDSFDGSGFLGNDDLIVISDVKVIASPGWSQKAVSGQVVYGSASYTTSSMFVTTNSISRPIAFYQDAGSDQWFVSDIGLETGSPTLTGAIVSWRNETELNFYAAAPSEQGLLIFKHNGDGMWEMRNLTTELGGDALNITSEITVFKDAAGIVYLAGLHSTGPGNNSIGKLVIYKQTGATSGGNAVWAFQNLHDTDLAQQGQTTPRFVGPLTSYVTAWDGLNIAGVDGNGDIHTVWWSPGETLWHTDNLSDLTGAPAYGTKISAFVSTWGGINLVGTDKFGNVTTTWWSPTDPWQTSNLTELFDGPKLDNSSLSSYTTSWGGLNIAGMANSKDLVLYWWAPDTNTWTVTTLSNSFSTPLPEMASITGVASPAGPINLVGTAVDGKVIRIYWTPPSATGGDVWAIQNLSDIARFL